MGNVVRNMGEDPGSHGASETENGKSFKKWRLMGSFQERRGHVKLGLRKIFRFDWKESK